MKYVRRLNTRTKMYAGRVACSLVSCVKYAPRALLRLETEMGHRQMDERTEGRQTETLRFPLDASSIKITNRETDS